jgi:hypothetical protein
MLRGYSNFVGGGSDRYKKVFCNGFTYLGEEEGF